MTGWIYGLYKDSRLSGASYKQLDISKVRIILIIMLRKQRLKIKRNKRKSHTRFSLDSEHSYDVRYLDILQKAGFEELHISREKHNDASFIYNEIAVIARRND